MTDRQLVARANAGDERALEALYRRHRAFVLSLAWRMTGSEADAQDVLQEVFKDLFSRFPGFRLTSSMRAWLYPVVKNRCISLHRRRRPVVDLSEVRGGEEPRIEARGEAGDFERMVSVLPRAQREVLVLRFGLGMKLDEIADALRISTGTVKSRLHYGLKALREAFPDLSPGE